MPVDEVAKHLLADHADRPTHQACVVVSRGEFRNAKDEKCNLDRIICRIHDEVMVDLDALLSTRTRTKRILTNVNRTRTRTGGGPVRTRARTRTCTRERFGYGYGGGGNFFFFENVGTDPSAEGVGKVSLG